MKKKELLKKVTAIALSAAMALSVVVGIPSTSITAKAAEYGLAGPRVVNGKVVYDTITFGNYWQNDTNGDGKADKQDDKIPIKWRVLSVDGDDAFLISNQILDIQRFEDERYCDSITWETCTLRKWLNSTFMDNAFSASEQALIKTTKVVNKGNPYFGTAGCDDTMDKLFLLSQEEVANPAYGFRYEDYLAEIREEDAGTIYCDVEDQYYTIRDYSKLRVPTAFCGGSDKKKREDLDTGSGCNGNVIGIGTVNWWLRSPGKNRGYAVSIYAASGVDDYGIYVSRPFDGVCPALHLDLSDSDLWTKTGILTCDIEGIGLYGTNHNHTYDKGIITSVQTCIKSGVKTYTCSCGDKKTEVVKATGVHTWDGGKITKEPTVSTEGVKTYTCSECKATKTEKIAKNPVVVPTVSKVKGASLTVKKKALTLKWNKVSGAKGYEVQYSTKSNFKSATKKTVVASKKSLSISKLKANKKYYVRIRAYKTYTDANGKTAKAYGTWVKLNKKTK